jgi:hypothetical protein
MNLFKTLFLSVIAVSLISVPACKKGPDDPALPFKSRTARLTGTWKLKSEERTSVHTKVNGGTTTTITDVQTFDGTNLTTKTTTKIGNSAATSNESKETYSETFTAGKDKSFSWEQVRNGFIITDDGNWAWVGPDEKADLKKREAFTYFVTRESFGGTVTEYSGPTTGVVMVLKKLSDKEIVVDLSETTTKPNNDVTTVTGTRTYAQ